MTHTLTRHTQLALHARLNDMSVPYAYEMTTYRGRYGLYVFLGGSVNADAFKGLGVDDRLIYSNHIADKMVTSILIADHTNTLDKARKWASIRRTLHAQKDNETKIEEIKQIMGGHHNDK